MSVSCPAREKEVRGKETVWDHVQVNSQSKSRIALLLVKTHQSYARIVTANKKSESSKSIETF